MPEEASLTRLFFSGQYRIRGKLFSNPIRQLEKASFEDECAIEPYHDGRNSGYLASSMTGSKCLIINQKFQVRNDIENVYWLPQETGYQSLLEPIGASNGTWLRPLPVGSSLALEDDWLRSCDSANESWGAGFSFKQELRNDGATNEPGLRAPQLGAVYAALSHWITTSAPGTIVMPTGTGKTETMLALLIKERIKRLLVLVPTDPLREQTAQKFITLGYLKKFGIVHPSAQFPVVGVLEHGLKSVEQAERFFRGCNVIVTTVQIISRASPEIQKKMVELCTHLFVDEAHHVPARTWSAVRQLFHERHILQFTATPYRNDRKLVDGKIIFDYPLSLAQREDLFKPIRFLGIQEFTQQRSDTTIAKTAITQLEADLAAGLDHVVMARTSAIDRAERVLRIYERLGQMYNPIIVHSRLSPSERREALRLLRERQTRIIVCVEMLGEGFDYPQLKIAALHDVHKSLAITLQFTGRFTRSQPNLGTATMIANIEDSNVEEALKNLYSEDADWNSILQRLSEGETEQQQRRHEFLTEFSELPQEIPLQNVFPKMSTVVYKTKCATWQPEKITELIGEDRLYSGPITNQIKNVSLFFTREVEPVPWGNVKSLQNLFWDLYLLHWDPETNLLFINSSNNRSIHEELAQTVAGDDVALIRGEDVFRALHGINRLILMNLGLNHALGRAIRFTMYVGPDIRDGLTGPQVANKYKSNLFGRGFEGGDKVTLGCSYKGRLWSYKIAGDIPEWVEWCHAIGKKLLDDTIAVNEIFRHVIIPKQISERPQLVPLDIEWSDEFLRNIDELHELRIAGETCPLFDVGIELVNHRRTGPIRFKVFTETKSVIYSMVFNENTVEYVPSAEPEAEIVFSRRNHRLSDWLKNYPPTVRFENGAFLESNLFFELEAVDVELFERERVEAWDWTGVNLRSESQKWDKRADSIQYRLVSTLKNGYGQYSYDVLMDDDDSGEAADVVGLKIEGDYLLIHLYHCKFATTGRPGARLDDLYAVCGQAQRSVSWRANPRRLIKHLLARNDSRMEQHQVSRFEIGDTDVLSNILKKEPYLKRKISVFIVQPGLSKTLITQEQLKLLAVTEHFLRTTYDSEFCVIGSP